MTREQANKAEIMRLRAALKTAAREERAICQRIALEYGGRDAEAIAEMIGERNFETTGK